MEIITRYKVGDDVWILDESGKHQVTITGISVDVCNTEQPVCPHICQAVTYRFNHGFSSRPEANVFATEEELLIRVKA